MCRRRSTLANALLVPALLLFALVGAGQAQAQDTLCDTPQRATASLLDYLQPDNWQPTKAAACLDVPEDGSKDASRQAIKLKKVLDARGLYVPTSELPQDADYTDELGRHRLEPLATFPEVYLVKKDGKWRYSRETVGLIDSLYANTFSGVSKAFQDLLPDVFFRRFAGLELWQVVYFLLLVGLSFLTGRVAQKLLSDQFLRVARRFRVQVPAGLVKRTRDPLTWLATGAVFLWGIPDLQLSVRQSQVLLLIARMLTAGAFVVVAVRMVDIGADLWARKAEATDSKLDDQVVPLVRRAVKIVIASVAALVVIENMGVDVAGLIAGLGIGGLAFALAAKDTLENVFGSVTIFLDRPFQVGDWVVIDGDVEGVVEEVGFRTTRVRTFYNSVLSVPNGRVAMARVDNMGRREYRRVKTTVGVTYDTPRKTLDAFVARIRALLQDDEAVWDGTLEVHFHSFGPSSLDIMVYFFLDVPDWTAELSNRHRLFSEIMGIAEELGVSFAFPSKSIYVESLPPQWATPGEST